MSTATASTDDIHLFSLVGADANPFAQERIGPDLTADEMARVRKYIEWGMSEHWPEIMRIAVQETIDEFGLKPKRKHKGRS